MEQMQPIRPFTLDLLKELIIELGGKLIEVIIYKLQGGVFFAKLLMEKAANTLVKLETRTSDAIALAIRFDAPIYALDEILQALAIPPDLFQSDALSGSHTRYSV